VLTPRQRRLTGTEEGRTGEQKIVEQAKEPEGDFGSSFGVFSVENVSIVSILLFWARKKGALHI